MPLGGYIGAEIVAYISWNWQFRSNKDFLKLNYRYCKILQLPTNFQVYSQA